jgi:hypothetical protein
MAHRADGYAALQRWRLALSKFLFFLLGNFNRREKENDKLLYAQERKRKKEP